MAPIAPRVCDGTICVSAPQAMRGRTIIGMVLGAPLSVHTPAMNCSAASSEGERKNSQAKQTK